MLRLKLLVGFISWMLLAAHAGAAEPLRLAVITPLSGSFALQGEWTVSQLRGAADLVNAKGGLFDGRKIEIVALDGKGNPQDSLLALNQAIDSGIRYVAVNISSVGHAVSDALVKHNARNPDRRIVLLLLDARDPVLTEAKCHFWQFRLTYHTDTEVNYLADYLAQQPAVRKIYLLNQDYAYGHSVQRTFRELLPKKSTTIQIVGDDLVPLGKVKDFAPYAAKIRASGADSVVTGNWGNDLYLLVKAGRESGLDVRYYIFNGHVSGSVAGVGNAGTGKVVSLFGWHANVDGSPYESFNVEFRNKYKRTENFDYLGAHRAVLMLARGVHEARSDDPLKVALALEDMEFDGPEGRTRIRPEDHQLIAPLYMARLTKAGEPGVKFDTENTGLGWKTVAKVEGKDAIPPIKCHVERPTQ
ncbi:MAG: branched-chain amino acid ABC transporter substrate-binding protein [Burkholderiales bacterium]